MTKNDSTFRVYHIPATDREAFIAKRESEEGLTNEKLITRAVRQHLESLTESLLGLGFKADEDRKTTRWSVSDDVLAQLKAASDRVGVPASQLLLLAIRAEIGGETVEPVEPVQVEPIPAKPAPKRARATRSAKATPKPTKAPRTASKAGTKPRTARTRRVAAKA